MSDAKRGRPAKAEGERLQPVSTNLRQEAYDAVCHIALKHDRPVADVLREMIDRQLAARQVGN